MIALTFIMELAPHRAQGTHIEPIPCDISFSFLAIYFWVGMAEPPIHELAIKQRQKTPGPLQRRRKDILFLRWAERSDAMVALQQRQGHVEVKVCRTAGSGS